MTTGGQRILTINSASSSLKIALFHMGKTETLAFSARVERIGRPGGHFAIKDGAGRLLVEARARFADHAAALDGYLKRLKQQNAARNRSNAAIISRAASPVTIRVMQTNEELMNARHTHAFVRRTK